MKVWTTVLSLNGHPPSLLSFCVLLLGVWWGGWNDNAINMLALQAHEDLNLISGTPVKKSSVPISQS